MKPNARWRMLQRCRPQSAAQLHTFVRMTMDLDVPSIALTPGHTPPMDYLTRAFFDRGDTVVWACRGGGKTMLGAVATVLDLLLKPGIDVRILAGSLEQASRMHEHLAALLDRPMLRRLTARPITQRRVELVNGSVVELLAMSHRSVRGVRVQKLRCDEVEEIEPDVWQAAQLVTRSETRGGERVAGTVEALSTMHRPFGLMSRLAQGPATLMKWNAIDVIERCPDERSCSSCLLWDDCGGRAKQATGFLRIEDLLAQRRRVDDATWASEVMCHRPAVSDCVYPNFVVERHVGVIGEEACAKPQAAWVAGMDFGLRGDTAVVWAVMRGEGLHVVADYVQSGRTVDQNLAAMAHQAPGPLQWIAVDPAGRARNEQTGMSNVELLQAQGYVVRTPRHPVDRGVVAVRTYLDRGRLHIHPRCRRLIQAMRAYHFDPARPAAPVPVKDGPDHICDALRYLVMAHAKRASPVVVKRYA